MREKKEYLVCDRRSVSCLFAFLHLYLLVHNHSHHPPSLPPSFFQQSSIVPRVSSPCLPPRSMAWKTPRKGRRANFSLLSGRIKGREGGREGGKG